MPQPAYTVTTSELSILNQMPPEIWLKILKRAILYPYYTACSTILESMTILQPPIPSPWFIRKKLRLVCRYWTSLLTGTRLPIVILGTPRLPYTKTTNVAIHPANASLNQTLWVQGVKICEEWRNPNPHCGHPWCRSNSNRDNSFELLSFSSALRGFWSREEQLPEYLLKRLPSDLLVLSRSAVSSHAGDRRIFSFDVLARFQKLTNLRLQLTAEAFNDTIDYNPVTLPALRTLWLSLTAYHINGLVESPKGIGLEYALLSLRLPKLKHIRLDGWYYPWMERGVRNLLTAYTSTVNGLILTLGSSPSYPRWWIKERTWTIYPHLTLLGLPLHDLAHSRICRSSDLSIPTFFLVITDFLKNIEASTLTDGQSYGYFYSRTMRMLVWYGEPVRFDCSWEEIRASIEEGRFMTWRLRFIENFLRYSMERGTRLYDIDGVELMDARAQSCIEYILRYEERRRKWLGQD